MSIDRRRFLKASAAVLAGAALAPVVRAAGAKIAITARDAVLKHVNAADCWAAVKALGIDGLEINATPEMTCPSLIHPQKKYALATPQDIAALKQDLAAGTKLNTFMMSNRIDERPEAEVAWMKKLVAASKDLGIRTIRVDIVPHKVKTAEEFLPIAIKVCKEFSAIAGDAGIRLAIENHGRVTNDPEFLTKLFDGVGAANLGLTMDTANFYWFGHPLEDIYTFFKRFAPRVFHTHCKSIRYPDDQKNVRRAMGWEYRKYTCPIYEGDIDFARVVKILKEAGYQADLCLENESLEKFPAEARAEVLKKEVALLRSIV